MLTKELVRQGIERTGGPTDDDNIEAFLRMCNAFECLDSDSFEEGKERLLASFLMLVAEIRDNPVPSKERRQEVLEMRGKLRGGYDFQ